MWRKPEKIVSRIVGHVFEADGLLPPSYREAYPALLFAKAIRRPGPREVTWVNQENEEIGAGAVMESSSGIFVFRYDLAAHLLADENAGIIQLHVKNGGNLDLGHNGQGLCTVCGKYKSSLYFRNTDWACAKCHDLSHVSSKKSKDQRLGEELLQLHATVGRGRPKGMNRYVFEARANRMYQLENELRGKPVRINERTQLRIFARWSVGGVLDKDDHDAPFRHPLPLSARARWG